MTRPSRGAGRRRLRRLGSGGRYVLARVRARSEVRLLVELAPGADIPPWGSPRAEPAVVCPGPARPRRRASWSWPRVARRARRAGGTYRRAGLLELGLVPGSSGRCAGSTSTCSCSVLSAVVVRVAGGALARAAAVWWALAGGPRRWSSSSGWAQGGMSGGGRGRRAARRAGARGTYRRARAPRARPPGDLGDLLVDVGRHGGLPGPVVGEGDGGEAQRGADGLAVPPGPPVVACASSGAWVLGHGRPLGGRGAPFGPSLRGCGGCPATPGGRRSRRGGGRRDARRARADIPSRGSPSSVELVVLELLGLELVARDIPSSWAAEGGGWAWSRLCVPATRRSPAPRWRGGVGAGQSVVAAIGRGDGSRIPTTLRPGPSGARGGARRRRRAR